MEWRSSQTDGGVFFGAQVSDHLADDGEADAITQMNDGTFIGRSLAIQRLKAIAAKVAMRSSTIMILSLIHI